MMAFEQLGQTHGISVRLVQVFRIYCGGLDGDTLADLRDDLRQGRYPWFRGEFEAAIRAGAFAARSWTPTMEVERSGELRTVGSPEQQRLIWTALFSDDPFPGDPLPSPAPAAHAKVQVERTSSRGPDRRSAGRPARRGTARRSPGT